MEPAGDPKPSWQFEYHKKEGSSVKWRNDVLYSEPFVLPLYDHTDVESFNEDSERVESLLKVRSSSRLADTFRLFF
jgi:hypothetical protein